MSKQNIYRIIGVFFIFQLFIVIYTLSLPKEYLSSATLLAPESESPGVVLNTPYGQLQNPELSQNALSSEAIIALLESRRLAKKVINRFKLFSIYNTQNEEIALKKYYSHLQASLDPEKGIIKVSFISTKPTLSRDIVLYMLNQLDTLNQTLKLTSRKPLAKIIDLPDLPKRKYKPHLSHNIIIGTFAYFSIVILLFALWDVLEGLKIE